MPFSEMESKHFTCPALNLMEGWLAQFPHTLSLRCGLRSSEPAEGDSDGKARETIERESVQMLALGFRSLLLNVKYTFGWLVFE